MPGKNGNGQVASATVPRSPAAVRNVAPGGGSAPGERLAGAFAAVESFPVSVDSRDRLVMAAAGDKLAAIADAVQNDLGLTLVVIRAACRKTNANGGVASIAKAVKALKASGVLGAAANAPVYDPLALSTVTEQMHQRLRAHALASQAAVYSICAELGNEDPAEAAVAAMMHDIGRIIVSRLHPDYNFEDDLAKRTPEQRIKSERERYGIDHAIAGGVLARRWDLPDRLAVAIERHHSDGAEGLAAMVALADQVAHLRAGDAVSLERVKLLSDRVGLKETGLRQILAGQPAAPPQAIEQTGDPCPLSERERDTLLKLSEGKVYKQIAEELDLSVSTVRTHLHNVYRKLDVVDRAQAVIKAREQGWV